MFSRDNLKKRILSCDVDRLCFLSSIPAFVLMYLLILRYMLASGLSLLNSDASSEMVLAAQLNREHAFLLSENWFYSSELRVLNTQLIYRIGLALFPHNWHWARLVSVAIFLLILAGSMILLMCAIGQKKYAFWAAIAIIAPFGQWYGWNVIFNSYYVPHIVLSVISLALLCMIVTCIQKSRSISKYGCIVLLLLVAFLSGLGGIRQLMICYVPLLAAGFALILLKKNFLSDTFPAATVFVMSVLSCIASGAGCLINITYLAKHYSFSDLAASSWQFFHLPTYLACVGDLVSLFGWQPKVPIFSPAGICNLLCPLFAAVLLFSAIYCIRHMKSLNVPAAVLLLYICAAFLVNLVICAGVKIYNESYWVPLLPFMFVPLFIMLSIAPPQKRYPHYGVFTLGGLGILLFVNSYLTMQNPQVISRLVEVPNDPNILAVSEWLKDTDYTQGIAPFWNSNIMTELSDGRIEMWTVEKGDNHLTPSTWLQSTSHETLPSGKIFLLFDQNEDLPQTHLPDTIETYVVYWDNNYIVYGFDDISQYFELLDKYPESLDD